MKSVVIATAKVFGPTELDLAQVAVSSAETILRSDYLDKLEAGIIAQDKNLTKSASALAFGVPGGVDTTAIVGFDADHPYITKETSKKKTTYHAWRYIAVLA